MPPVSRRSNGTADAASSFELPLLTLRCRRIVELCGALAGGLRADLGAYETWSSS